MEKEQFHLRYAHHAKTVKASVTWLRRYSDKIKYVILYGSIARHEERYRSDVDLMIVFHDDVSERERRNVRTDLLNIDNLESELDVHVMSEQEYQNTDTSFIRHVKEEGVYL